MDKYRQMVKRNADFKSKDLIPNGGVEHAEVLIENIFSHANNTVRVFSGCLNGRVYGSDSVTTEAAAFLKNSDNQLMILLQDIEDWAELDNNELVKICDRDNSGRCIIKKVVPEDKDIESHFVVMDDRGYRIEPDKSKPTGIGCFNDTELATKLNQRFDEMFKRAEDRSQQH